MPQRAAFQFGAEAVCRLCNQQQEKQRDTGIKTINKMSPGVVGDGIVKTVRIHQAVPGGSPCI